jgi:RNA polymerase sigma-B factor
VPETYEQRDVLDVALIRLYRATRDPRRLERLVQRFTPLVRSIVRPYVGRGEAQDDLLQVGMLGLLKAIERFDEEGGSFGAYARPTISGEVKRHFRDHTWAVKVPRSMQELGAKVSHARRADPAASTSEIAAHVGASVESVMEAEIAHDAYRVRSLDYRAPDEDASPMDHVSSVETGYEEVALRDEVADALSVLGPRDREIVELRYFDDQLQREIGTGVGVSQMQVSRLLNRAIDTMRDHLTGPDGLADVRRGDGSAPSGSSVVTP